MILVYKKNTDGQKDLRKTIQRCFVYFPTWVVEIDQTSVQGCILHFFEEIV